MKKAMLAKKEKRAAQAKEKRKQERAKKINDEKEMINMGLFRQIKLNVELEVNKQEKLAQQKAKIKKYKQDLRNQRVNSDSSHDDYVPVIAEGRVILKDDYVDKLNNSDEEDLNDLKKAQKEKILNT